MYIDRKRVQRVFLDYVSAFDQSDEAIQLKLHHTFRVSTNSEIIAKGLGLGAGDVDVAWLIGVLHDIGRFEQLKLYHTFLDAKSMSHAAFGVDYLFQKGHIRDFIDDDEEDDFIDAAIANHSAFAIKDGLTDRQLLFCKLIRDADKADIFRVYVSYLQKLPVIWGATFDELLGADLTPQVRDEARQHRTIVTTHKKTPMDFFVGGLCLWYDVNFDVSKRLIREQGYYDQLLAIHSKNKETESFLEKLRYDITNV